MGSSRIINTKIAIEESKAIHGNKYDYSLLEYINYTIPLKIICKEHGVFKQKYQKHCKLGRGCWECGKKSCIENRLTLTQELLVERAHKIHDNFYNYDKTIYKNYSDKITIICPIHGEFLQLVNTHLQGGGCVNCGKIKAGKSRRVGKVHILNLFTKKHGDFYTYEIEEDSKTDDIISIICPIHGKFSQIVNVHYYCGCPKCGNEVISKKLRKIPKELDNLCNNVRRRVKGFIKAKGYKKSSKTSEILGTSWENLKLHLEDNNYGFLINSKGIDVDHIIPLCSAKTENDIYKLNHYTNLQLLPSEYNQFIKSNNDFNRLHFETWLKNNPIPIDNV
jgi:hypothetical protein